MPAFDEEEFETEEDVRALQRAQEIADDPQRKARAERKVRKTMRALKMTQRDGATVAKGFRRL